MTKEDKRELGGILLLVVIFLIFSFILLLKINRQSIETNIKSDIEQIIEAKHDSLVNSRLQIDSLINNHQISSEKPQD